MKVLTFLLLTLSMLMSNNYPQLPTPQLVVGDTLVIGASKSYGFDHIKFTRSNFLIKQGKLPNHGKVSGTVVVINEISDDQSVAYLSPVGDEQFFDGKKRVKAYLKKALATGELKVVRP